MKAIDRTPSWSQEIHITRQTFYVIRIIQRMKPMFIFFSFWEAERFTVCYSMWAYIRNLWVILDWTRLRGINIQFEMVIKMEIYLLKQDINSESFPINFGYNNHLFLYFNYGKKMLCYSEPWFRLSVVWRDGPEVLMWKAHGAHLNLSFCVPCLKLACVIQNKVRAVFLKPSMWHLGKFTTWSLPLCCILMLSAWGISHCLLTRKISTLCLCYSLPLLYRTTRLLLPVCTICVGT